MPYGIKLANHRRGDININICPGYLANVDKGIQDQESCFLQSEQYLVEQRWQHHSFFLRVRFTAGAHLVLAQLLPAQHWPDAGLVSPVRGLDTSTSAHTDAQASANFANVLLLSRDVTAFCAANDIMFATKD
jgi:hypothetical protein